MFSLFELLYEFGYYIYKNREQLKWDAVILFIVHAWGKRSGMKMFRKFLVSHFKQLEDEETQWRKWVAKQIEQLGGDRFIPQRQYRGATRSKKFLARNSAMSLTSSQPDMHQDEQRRNPNMAILVIDPGHGGKDPGAISCTKKQEKDFNLTVALKVEERFKAIPDVKVILTRSTDTFIELNDRAAIANAARQTRSSLFTLIAS
jgi:N-acetylmuramoyl-L-alanine amidase